MNLKALLLAVLLLAAPAASAQQPVAIRAGRVITENGRAIENGTVLVRDGRIEKLGGGDLKIPF
ncbi:MAG: amidohydrolase family protein, partial [Planctomycetota bacterium]